MLKRKTQEVIVETNSEKMLDIDANMQGNLTFKDPVNIRINGDFEGTLDTLGTLTIGENATVKAKVSGEAIVLKGELIGDVIATVSLELHAKGRLIGEVTTPSIAMQKGAVLQGQLNMIAESGGSKDTSINNRSAEYYNANELAKYLSVEKALVFEWADSGKLPGIREGSTWRFDKKKVDEWVASGMIK